MTSRSKPRRRDPAAVEAMKETVLADLAKVRAALVADRTLNEAEGEALASVETFVAIALRVMSTVNASKIKDAMMVVEIQARMDGRYVFEGEA